MCLSVCLQERTLVCCVPLAYAFVLPARRLQVHDALMRQVAPPRRERTPQHSPEPAPATCRFQRTLSAPQARPVPQGCLGRAMQGMQGRGVRECPWGWREVLRMGWPWDGIGVPLALLALALAVVWTCTCLDCRAVPARVRQVYA